MTSAAPATGAHSLAAFATLPLIALMLGANHVAVRVRPSLALVFTQHEAGALDGRVPTFTTIATVAALALAAASAQGGRTGRRRLPRGGAPCC